MNHLASVAEQTDETAAATLEGKRKRREAVTAPVIGVDVGGTGIKAAAVRVVTGELITQRRRKDTPTGAKPNEVAETIAQLVAVVRKDLEKQELTPHPVVGVCVPAVVKQGVTMSAANIDDEWIGLAAEEMLSDLLTREHGMTCRLLNDADAAGEAEVDFGAAAGQPGLTIVLTLGTGIGSALLWNGELIVGSELGHLQLDGHEHYERHASPKNIKNKGISFSEWVSRLTPYIQHLEMLFSPNLFVLGGSISKNADDFLPLEGVQARVEAAHFRNNAGIVGSAGFATQG